MEILSEFTKIFNFISSKYDRYTVFYDLVKMCSISIYNSIAKNEDLEKEYLSTINKYDKEIQNLFPKLFAELVMEYERKAQIEITDILGPFYEREKLSNGKLGQFFTPTHISNFIAEISIGDEESLKKEIEDKGFITLAEPACGAGGMILSFAKALQKRNINCQTSLLVEATDISEFCCYITYLQLALYGIPAVVYCGDTLSQKMRFKLVTPTYFLNYWKFRSFYNQNTKEEHDKDLLEESNKSEDIYKESIVDGNKRSC